MLASAIRLMRHMTGPPSVCRRFTTAMEGLGRAPFQGTLRQDLMPGLRQVTKDQAIFYFTTDEPAHRLTVLAIFFGGQDHRRHMLIRLSGEG